MPSSKEDSDRLAGEIGKGVGGTSVAGGWVATGKVGVAWSSKPGNALDERVKTKTTPIKTAQIRNVMIVDHLNSAQSFWKKFILAPFLKSCPGRRSLFHGPVN